jgi:DNA-binding transcriptional LysR family regulator
VIGRTTAALYASRDLLGDRRLRVSDVESARGLPLLVFTAPFHMLQEARWFQPLLAAGPIAIETNSTHALLEAARAGIGLAVLPRFVARGHGDLVCVSDPVAEHDVWLITHPEFRRDPRVRAVSEFLTRVASGANGVV